MVAKNVNFPTLSGSIGRAPVRVSSLDNSDSIGVSRNPTHRSDTMSNRKQQAVAEQAEQNPEIYTSPDGEEIELVRDFGRIKNGTLAVVAAAGQSTGAREQSKLAGSNLKALVRGYVLTRPSVQELTDNINAVVNGGGPLAPEKVKDSKPRKTAYSTFSRYWQDAEVCSLPAAPDAEYSDRYVVSFGKPTDGVRRVDVTFQTARIVQAEAEAEQVKAEAERKAADIREQAEQAEQQAQFLARPLPELVAELEAHIAATYGERASEVIGALIDSRTESNANAA